MEEAIEIDIDMDITIAEALRRMQTKKKTSQSKSEAAAEMLSPDKDTPTPQIDVSRFDNSVDNHFKALDTIAELCGEEADLQFDHIELERLSSSITFLREWKFFNYKPRVVRFACQSESPQGKDVMGEITLPQYSAAVVPKNEKQSGNTVSSDSRKDFVLYVGGSVWALDWCPSLHQNSASHAKSEFLAVAAHPPEALYHKLGAPLTGRGLIQIWCLLNDKFKKEYVSPQVRWNSTQPQRKRGRPRKRPLSESEDDSCIGKELVLHAEASEDTHEQNSTNYSVKTQPSSCKDIELPRPVLCLAHNGKVAWDVKWRPSDSYDANSKHRMGFLAVLLGNGALEVWDVPSPHAVKVVYSTKRKDGTDPRFVKLDPVFRCSKLKSGDRQSVPLTVEWSTSPPHDLILAGCHDGVVALWKFSPGVSSKDTRPLVCFSADTVPIRALAWAPNYSDPESANVIVTAGHRGLKFWDIRDPFYPLWDINPVQKEIYSLDWMPDPRCIIISYEDGTIRILSVSEAANDVAVTGKPYAGTQQGGLHRYCCSSYAIWSIQVSRLTGMVAYCSADGNVLCFQLTAKAVGKDPLRHRAPHFLCGSLIEEGSSLTMYTPLPAVPVPVKKQSNQEKRLKVDIGTDQTSTKLPLALCNGDDPGVESDSEDMDMMAEMRKKSSKTKTKSSKTPKTSQALVCREEDPQPLQLEKANANEETGEIEVLPPKSIAMHRVRWNINKGSERWLCYGGASGIVRCQEI